MGSLAGSSLPVPTEEVGDWLQQLNCEGIGAIQVLRAPHGKWQGQWCSLFIPVDPEELLEGNMEKMRSDASNPKLTVGGLDCLV